MKTTEELMNEFKLLNNDLDRWKWIIENKNEQNLPPVMLDNDCTDIGFYYMNDNDKEIGKNFYFDNYIGYDKGLFTLLKAIGIKAEGV
jgi:hypothetical protein